MEHFLEAQGLFPFRSAAASFGGRHDEGRELTERGRKIVHGRHREEQPALIRTKTLREDIDERMASISGRTRRRSTST